MKIERFIVLSGYILLVLGIFDFVLKTRIYGYDQLDFLWFCSITMLILGLGMTLKSPMLLNSFLSMALVVQPFWIMDYIWESFFDTSLNGLSLFVFQPGFSFMQFADNAKHLFMIPFGFFAVFAASRKNHSSYWFIPLFITSLLVSSRLFAPEYTNLNCVFNNCLKWPSSANGFLYFLIFLVLAITASLLINSLINLALEKSKRFKSKIAYKNSIFLIFLSLLFISSLIVSFSYIKYSKIPKYKCSEAINCDNCAVNAKCGYIDWDAENNIFLVYTVKNFDNDNYVCDFFMKILPTDTDLKKIANNSYIESNKKYKITYTLPYPNADSQIQLKSDCRLYR